MQVEDVIAILLILVFVGCPLFLIFFPDAKLPFRMRIKFVKYRFFRSFIDARYVYCKNLVGIHFTKHADGQSLRNALCDVFRSQGSDLGVIFTGKTIIPDPTVFDPFSFAYLDFYDVDNICNYDRFLCAPSSMVVLPKNTTHVEFFDNPLLQYVAISADHVIPAFVVHCSRPLLSSGDVPVRVHSGFRILVPEDLVDAYRSDDHWQSISFIDENGAVFPPEFAPNWQRR